MSEECIAAVKINQDLCSHCSVCYSICPFEAITRDEETCDVEIDIQKCQVCGICYSACPVKAIEMSYYTYENLIDYVQTYYNKAKDEPLVLMCRGNSPSNCEINEILAQEHINVEGYIPLRLPCAGRVPTDFVFKVLSLGIKNIFSIQCEDAFCRMKEGTQINTQRFILSKNVLSQLGYSDDSLRVIKFSRKAIWDNEECVGCDKCVFICPYDAIKAEPFSSPTVDDSKCVGCGACQLVCPHNAIEVKGYEFENTLNKYAEASSKLKAQTNEPSILVFSCQWSEYSGLDNPDSILKGKNAVVLEVPCFKGMDPVHVVKALQCGFDGVMGVVCSSDDCKLEKGRDTSERNLETLKIVLKNMNLLDRFEMVELSPRCEGKFVPKFENFYQKISSIPKSVDIKTEAK